MAKFIAHNRLYTEFGYVSDMARYVVKGYYGIEWGNEKQYVIKKIIFFILTIKYNK